MLLTQGTNAINKSPPPRTKGTPRAPHPVQIGPPPSPTPSLTRGAGGPRPPA